MSTKSITWNDILDVTMKMPGIKVNRTEFLMNVFKPFGDVSEIQSKRPVDLFDSEIIEKAAKDVINGQTLKVTAISTAAGIPGGLALFGTVPADLAQYYFHVIVLAQKLGYIYGWSDLQEEDGSFSEGAKNVLTVFVGVMFGAQAANEALTALSKSFATQVAKRVSQMALTKTSLYPVIKQIGKWLGVKITKAVFSKGLSKIIPVIGGFLSGGITLATFRPMANKLRNELKTEMELASSKKFSSSYDDFEEAKVIISEEEFEELCIRICINAAKSDSRINKKERKFLSDMIKSSSLTTDKKRQLESIMKANTFEDINYNSYGLDNIFTSALIENVLLLINVDEAMNPAEESYLKQIAKAFGIADDSLEEMILSSRGV